MLTMSDLLNDKEKLMRFEENQRKAFMHIIKSRKLDIDLEDALIFFADYFKKLCEYEKVNIFSYLEDKGFDVDKSGGAWNNSGIGVE